MLQQHWIGSLEFEDTRQEFKAFRDPMFTLCPTNDLPLSENMKISVLSETEPNKKQLIIFKQLS